VYSSPSGNGLAPWDAGLRSASMSLWLPVWPTHSAFTVLSAGRHPIRHAMLNGVVARAFSSSLNPCVTKKPAGFSVRTEYVHDGITLILCDAVCRPVYRISHDVLCVFTVLHLSVFGPTVLTACLQLHIHDKNIIYFAFHIMAKFLRPVVSAADTN
jgi:hypothetical protein